MENKEELDVLIGRLKESGTLMESAQKAYGSRAKIFSNNLKRNMSKNNISVHRLCKVVGTDDFKKIAGWENISDTVVNGWVKGWRLPSSSQMYALLVLFGVEVSDFFQITKCNDEKILAPDSEIKCVLSYSGEREIRVKFKNVLSDGTDFFLSIKMVLNTDWKVIIGVWENEYLCNNDNYPLRIIRITTKNFNELVPDIHTGRFYEELPLSLIEDENIRMFY